MAVPDHFDTGTHPTDKKPLTVTIRPDRLAGLTNRNQPRFEHFFDDALAQ